MKCMGIKVILTKELRNTPIKFIRVQFENGDTKPAYIQIAQLAVYAVNNGLVNIAPQVTFSTVFTLQLSKKRWLKLNDSAQRAIDGTT